MSYCDYRHCDACDAKAFYDANLNYEQPAPEGESIRGWPETKLDSLGDWVVLCRECAKTHECKIVVKEPR